MKKICIAALAATLALGTMITAQAADTTEPTYPKQYRSVNGGPLRGLKSPAGGRGKNSLTAPGNIISQKVSKQLTTGWRSTEPGTISVMTTSCRPAG